MSDPNDPEVGAIDPELVRQPAWRALELISQRPASARGGLDLVQMHQAVIEGWDRGVGPLRALWQAGMSDDALNIFVWASIRDLEVVDLGDFVITQAILGSLSPTKAKTLHVLPLTRSEDGRQLTAAISNLNNMQALQELQHHFPDVEINLVLAEPKDIDSVIERLQEQEASTNIGALVANLESGLVQIVEEEDPDVDEGVVQLMRSVVEQAINARASDVHIDPTERDSVVRMRIDGVLQLVSRQDMRIHPQMTNYIKTKAHLDIANQRIPQDGAYSIRASDGTQIHMRVATMPTNHRLGDIPLEKITLRLIASDETLTSLEALGMRADSLGWVKDCFTNSSGMVVIAGPTGSGKTTTLYSALKGLVSDAVNIMTIEDPIERRLVGINQTQVNAKAGMGYPQALRGFLRHDPDVLLVGEIRADIETVRTAMEAAMTGRLVLTSTHTSSSAEVPTRMNFMGIEPFMIASALRAAISQRLLRSLCPRCRVEHDNPALIDTVEWPDGCIIPEVLYRPGPRGCSWCKHTGYRGRSAIVEVLVVDEGIQDLICSRVPTRDIHEYAVKLGMRTLFGDALMKVAEGITSLEEASRILA